MGPIFQDRSDAGKFLAKKLLRHADDPSGIVLALPRGGVPVAYEVVRSLRVPLDVFIVRKLGVPGYEELAMGAIATGNVRVLNEDLIRRLSVTPSAIEEVTSVEEQELARQESLFRGSRGPIAIEGRNVILVDDGLATGATMRAAVRALREQHPAHITIAVPVGSKDTCEDFRHEVDELVCGDTPEPFYAVGTWYANFLPTTDDEVKAFLDRAEKERLARVARDQKAFAS